MSGMAGQTAQARQTKYHELPKSLQAKVDQSKCEAQLKTCQRLHQQFRSMHRDRSAVRFCMHHPKATIFCTMSRMFGTTARLDWTRRAIKRNIARLKPDPIPHLAQWLCIHRYEGSWTDPGSPYYGGLQMDIGFQMAYGLDLYRAKGTADHWTPREQMMVAEVAFKTRGFGPWPNTARYCGLL